jgi:UDP-N-acetylglucosamine 2-epimerase (hydrolysing)
MDRVEDEHELHVFVTGMHLLERYGHTWTEVKKRGYENIHLFDNEAGGMDLNLAKTIEGFSQCVKEIEPDLIVVHGDRGESLAAAIVGAMNNIVVCHIEGGEVSGTVDEHLRHAISKLCQIHCVANDAAKARLEQMGERDIHVIGSPDVDVILGSLPTLSAVKDRYQIPYDEYAIFLYHPVTTEYFALELEVLMDQVLASGINIVAIYPNNDTGSELIINQLTRFETVFSSMRFEYFLTLLKNAEFIIGNSSCGLMEAPYYGTPTINIGSRQAGRAEIDCVINCKAWEVQDAISHTHPWEPVQPFGLGNSASKFMDVIAEPRDVQKTFNDLVSE